MFHVKHCEFARPRGRYRVGRTVAASGGPWDTPPRRRQRPERHAHEQRRARPWPICRGSSAMSLFVAEIGATVTAIVELTVGPYIRVGDAQPHLVFVFAVVWTFAIGFESGLVWALVGGIALDVLA